MNRWTKFLLAFLGILLVASPAAYYYRKPIRNLYRQVAWKADRMVTEDARSRARESTAAGQKFSSLSTRIFEILAGPGGWILIVGIAVIGMLFVRGGPSGAR